ncbi:MAG: hypothetical protein A2X49_08950 [Lentisphaerae bacterium GWF2_52_8]|nr:MAG: hypothetical protein A2X49_08950 [Lentisphaerae bacterium GWF2_52_8]
MKKVLTIDGGGIRGVIPASILANLEARLQIAKNDPNLRIADCFDMLAGTSTGGILTALFLSPQRYRASEILEFYQQLGPTLFHRTIWQMAASGFGLFRSRYKEDALYDFSKKLLGDTYISEVAKECLITAYEMSSRKALLFSRHAVTKYGSMADYRLCDIVRATTAAPTYFSPAKVYPRSSHEAAEKGASAESLPFRNLVDGGIYANNPSMCALVESIKLWPDVGITGYSMLSVGTGKAEKPYLYEKTRRFGYIGWLSPIIDIMLSSVAETVNYQMNQVFTSVGAPENYIRIEPLLLDADVDMDNASPKNIRALVNAAQYFIDHNGHLLDKLVETYS